MQHSQQTTGQNAGSAESNEGCEPTKASESGAAEIPRRRGMVHHRAQRKTAYGLAWGLLAVAACNAVPAMYDVTLHFQAVEASHVPLWVYIVFLLSLLQCAYAVYLFQLPDWSSVWMTALASLAQTAFYAMLAAIFYLTKDGAAHQWLDLDSSYVNKAALWCFLMVCLNGLLAYFAGRASVRWRKTAMQWRN